MYPSINTRSASTENISTSTESTTIPTFPSFFCDLICPWHYNQSHVWPLQRTCSAKFCDKFYIRADIFEGRFCATPSPIKNQDI